MVNNLHQSINPSGAPVAVTPTTQSITSTRHPSLHTAQACQPPTHQTSAHLQPFPLPLSSHSTPSHSPSLPFQLKFPLPQSLSYSPTTLLVRKPSLSSPLLLPLSLHSHPFPFHPLSATVHPFSASKHSTIPFPPLSGSTLLSSNRYEFFLFTISLWLSSTQVIFPIAPLSPFPSINILPASLRMHHNSYSVPSSIHSLSTHHQPVSALFLSFSHPINPLSLPSSILTTIQPCILFNNVILIHRTHLHELSMVFLSLSQVHSHSTHSHTYSTFS